MNNYHRPCCLRLHHPCLNFIAERYTCELVNEYSRSSIGSYLDLLDHVLLELVASKFTYSVD
jgi:hypothetical protein